jgi:hypothetical protein
MRFMRKSSGFSGRQTASNPPFANFLNEQHVRKIETRGRRISEKVDQEILMIKEVPCPNPLGLSGAALPVDPASWQ